MALCFETEVTNMYNLCVFTCTIVMFVFHCTHVRMSYVLNSYLLTYLRRLGLKSRPKFQTFPSSIEIMGVIGDMSESILRT